jgi:hypothetical protein
MASIITNPVQRFGSKYFQFWCHCPIDVVELIVIVARNGRKQYRPRCFSCGHYPRRLILNIPHRLLTPAERETASILRVNNPKPRQQCVRCGTWAEVEVHHWAPRAKFVDCEEWPTSALCRECHIRWHQVMETPHARARNDKMSEHELEDARYVADELDRWEDRARMIDQVRDAEEEDGQ